MGIISDIFESNRERVGRILSSLPSPRKDTGDSVHLSIQCPICSDFLMDEISLQRHILDRHRRNQFYLKLNGNVLQDVCFNEHQIDELIAVLLGDASGMVRIEAPDRAPHQIPIRPGAPLRLNDYVEKRSVGVLKISLSVQQTVKNYTVFCSTQPTVDVDQMNVAIGRLQEGLTQSSGPDFATFQQRYLHAATTNDLERRYLGGFFSYLLGCHLERQGDDDQAGKHFEEALGQLRPFSTDLAHTTRCILALKLNAFGLLSECRSTSVFYQSRLFFLGSGEGSTRKSSSATTASGVWVDEFFEGMLESITLFYRREFEALESLMSTLKISRYYQEPNNHDKMALIQGRAAGAQGRKDVAVRSYSYLLHHPIFGKEAEIYIENNG